MFTGGNNNSDAILELLGEVKDMMIQKREERLTLSGSHLTNGDYEIRF